MDNILSFVKTATKTANMSSEQLRSYVASGVADMRPEHDLDHVLSRSVELVCFCVCVGAGGAWLSV